MINYNDLIEEIIEISINAGEAILEIYADESKFNINEKEDSSPLTQADLNANDIIVRGLENMEPKFPVISEESKRTPFAIRESYKHLWMVDPLDGTKEFLKRNGEFTVNIALIENGSPVLGVVYVPVSKTVYFASRSNGAFKRIGGKNSRITANEYRQSDSGLRVVCSRSHINTQTQAFIDSLKEPVIVPCGSSLKFTTIAEGQAEVYPRIGPTMEWDTAAAQVILEEAGGSISHSKSGHPLVYNKEDLKNPNFVARAQLIAG